MSTELNHNVSDVGTETRKGVVASSVEFKGTSNGHAGYGFKLRGPKGRRTMVPDVKEQDR